jgi:hypothetical protein
MSVVHWTNKSTGRIYREIKDDCYAALSELKRIYEADGHQTWLNLWYGPTNTWVLTVKL